MACACKRLAAKSLSGLYVTMTVAVLLFCGMIVSLYILQNIHVENIYGIEAQTYDADDRRTHRALFDCIEKAGVNDYVNNAIEFAYAKRQHGQRGKEKEYKYRHR